MMTFFKILNKNYFISSGEGKRGTSEDVFIKIFGHESYDQLKLMFEKYKHVSSGHTIEQAIKAELSGTIRDSLLAIGEKRLFFYERRMSETSFLTRQKILIP